MNYGPTLFELVMEADQEPLGTPLVRYLTALGADELLVLSFIAGRLEAGRAVYGDLDIMGDPRDWAVEAGQEAADLLIYAAADAIREMAHGRPASRRRLSVVPREGE